MPGPEECGRTMNATKFYSINGSIEVNGPSIQYSHLLFRKMTLA